MTPAPAPAPAPGREPIVRTRFAPSPSGHLHVGGARTALFNWAFAKHHGGKFILRIEDTDQKRSSGAASVGFLNDLKWLGIDWDEGPVLDDLGGGTNGPYFQSERLDIYAQHTERLIAEGKAYRAFETPEELDAARAEARQAGKNYRHPRKLLDEAAVAKLMEEGVPSVVRFKLPDDVASKLTFHDDVLGEITTEPELIDDFVIVKADGYPTYHFAVVVDDALMGVTHVIRAQEHTNNTFKHILLQEALGFARPSYAHVSIIFNPDGSKMSKRDKAKAVRAELKKSVLEGRSVDDLIKSLMSFMLASRLDRFALSENWRTDKHQFQADVELLYNKFMAGDSDDLSFCEMVAHVRGIPLPEINVDDFRRAGYLPDVLINFIALLGWNPGSDIEKFDAKFLAEHFAMDRMIKSPAKFDRIKLLAFNLDALQAMPPDEFVRRVREHGEEFHPEFIARFPGEQFDLFASCNQARSKTLDDPFRSCRFMIAADDAITWEDSKPVRKALDGGEPNGLQLLELVLPVLAAQEDWSPAELEAAVSKFAEKQAGGNLGKIAQPLRIAVSGGPVSPAIFETLSLIGREHVINRVKRCIAWRRASALSEPRP